MKKKLLYLLFLVCTIGTMVSCTDTPPSEKATTYSKETLALNYSNTQMLGKSIDVNVSGTTAHVKLFNIIPGEAILQLNPTEINGTTEGYTLKGTTITDNGEVSYEGTLKNSVLTFSVLYNMNTNAIIKNWFYNLTTTVKPLNIVWESDATSADGMTASDLATLVSDLASEQIIASSNGIEFSIDGNIIPKDLAGNIVGPLNIAMYSIENNNSLRAMFNFPTDELPTIPEDIPGIDLIAQELIDFVTGIAKDGVVVNYIITGDNLTISYSIPSELFKTIADMMVKIIDNLPADPDLDMIIAIIEPLITVIEKTTKFEVTLNLKATE